MVMMTEAKQEDTPKVSDTETKALKVNYISSIWCKVMCAVKFIALYVLSAKYLTPAHVIQRRQKRMYYTDSAGNIPIKPTLKERFMDLFKTDEKRKAELLKWANSRISPLSVFDFSTSWQDGIALCSLLESVKPGLCPGYRHLEHHNMVNNCRLGLRLAQQCLNVPQNMISPEEMAIGDVKAELKLFYLISIIKCLSEKKDLEISTPQDVQPQCSIRGSGVNTGVIGKKCRFTVFLSDIFGILDLSVHIKGPQNEMYSEKIINLLQAGEEDTSLTEKNATEVIGYIEDGCGNKFVRLEDGRHITATAKLNTVVFTCQSSGKGSFLMSYIPVSAGIHTVSIRLLNNHVGGSPFKAKIYQPSDLNRKSMKEEMGKRFLFESLSMGSLEDVAQDMLKESGGAVAQIGSKNDNPKQKKLRRQYTIKNKRVLRKVITKNGEEIVVQDISSPSLSRETSLNTDSDVADSEDNKNHSTSTSKSIQKTKEACTNRQGRVKAMDSINDVENRHFNNSSQTTKELQDATRKLFKLGTNKSNNESKNELSIEEKQRLFKDKFVFCKIPLTDEKNNLEENDQKPESKLSKAFTESVMLLKKKYELIDELDKNPECVDDILRKENDVFEMTKDTNDVTQHSSASEEVAETGSSGVDTPKKNDIILVTNNEESDSPPSDSLIKETQKLKIIMSDSMSKSCCYMTNCDEKKTRNSINEENGSDTTNTDHEKEHLDYLNSLPERNLSKVKQTENSCAKENLFALTKRWQSFDVDTETDLMQIRKIFRMEDKLFGREGLIEGTMKISQNDLEIHQGHQEYADLTSKDGGCCPESETNLQAAGSDPPIHHQTDLSEMSIVDTGEIDIVKSEEQTHLKQEYSTTLNMTEIVQESNTNCQILPNADEKIECDQVLKKPNAYSPTQQDVATSSERDVPNDIGDEISGLNIKEFSDLTMGLENDKKTLPCQSEIGQSQSKLPMMTAFRIISSFESAFDGKILTPKPHAEKYTQVTSDEIIQETGWKFYSSMISIHRRKVNINVPSSFDKLESNDISSQEHGHCNLSRHRTTSPEVENILKNKTESSTLQSDIHKWLQSNLTHHGQENQVRRVGRQSTIDTIDSGIMEELPKKPSRNISFSNESPSPVRMFQNGHRPTYCNRNRCDNFLNPELAQTTGTNTVISEPQSFYSELKIQLSKSRDGSGIPQFNPTVYLTTQKYLRFLPRDHSFSFSDSETKNASSNCEAYKTVVKRSFEDDVSTLVPGNSKDVLIPCEKRLGRVDFSISTDSTRMQNSRVKDSKEKLFSADVESTFLRPDSPECKLNQKSESESFDDNYFGFGVSKVGRSALLNQLAGFKQLSNQDSVVIRKENMQESSILTSASHVPTITSRESEDLRSIFSSKSADKCSDSIATRYDEILPRHHTNQITYGEIQNPITNNFDVNADYFNVCGPFETEDVDNTFVADGLGLCSGQVGCKNNFQVWAKTTMNGCPTVRIIGPRPHCVTEICVVYTGDNLYEVMYEVSHPGFYIIVVKWADMEISESPFICKISY